MIKKVTYYFGLAFLFLLLILLINQLLLLTVFSPSQFSFSRIVLMLVHSLPSICGLALPFAVGIGFVQGIIRILKPGETPEKNSKIIHTKMLRPILCLGLIVSALDFAVLAFAIPGANSSFAALYRGGTASKHPREMTLSEISLEMKSLRQNKTARSPFVLNIYNLEINKKFSIPLAALFFAFFAFSFSWLIKRKPRIALGISAAVCVLYWLVITYGEILSSRGGHFGALAMWLPNILLLAAAVLFYRRQRKVSGVE
jgi:lipopolysaccharide export LptBFGC system permease protein LptF